MNNKKIEIIWGIALLLVGVILILNLTFPISIINFSLNIYKSGLQITMLFFI